MAVIIKRWDLAAPAVKYDPVLEREVTFVVHTGRAPTESLRGEIQQTVWQVNGNLPVASMQTGGNLQPPDGAHVVNARDAGNRGGHGPRD